MKIIFAVPWLIIASMVHADERVAVKPASGRFEVIQDYQGERDRGNGEFIETIRFRDAAFPAVRLAGFSWPGIYHISPDERWLLRIQKTGSGDSIGILYQLEKNGRVSEVLGFDDLLWMISDQTSRLKKKGLYHTGIAEVAWAKNSGSLAIDLHGSNTAKSGDGIEIRVTYDLETNKATIKEIKSEQGSGGSGGQRR